VRSRPALALPYLTAFGLLNAYLWPRTGKDRIPVLGYSTALLAMALTALNTGSPRAAGGGALFMLSDSLLALEKFAGIQLPAHEGLVMATYTSAQALLALPRDLARPRDLALPLVPCPSWTATAIVLAPISGATPLGTISAADTGWCRCSAGRGRSAMRPRCIVALHEGRARRCRNVPGFARLAPPGRPAVRGGPR
jgi:YhhN family